MEMDRSRLSFLLRRSQTCVSSRMKEARRISQCWISEAKRWWYRSSRCTRILAKVAVLPLSMLNCLRWPLRWLNALWSHCRPAAYRREPANLAQICWWKSITMVRSPSGWKDESSVKQSLERFVQRKDGILYIGRAIIFIGYIYVRVITTLSALKSPRELEDTKIYLRISSQPILGPEFLSVDRPFVFPLLLQIVHQDFASAAIIQLVVALLAWGLLALAISASLRPPWLRLLSFFIILAVGTVRHLAGWDSVMMTESLSLSMLGLFIASGIWLLHGWKYHKVFALCAAAFLFAFARDTNAYVLVMFAGLMLIAVLFRWMNPRALVLAGVFGMFFFVSDLNANTSQRWFFPLVNVIGKRILPYTESIQNLAACGMPITPQLLSLADTFANGNDRAFFNDPALAGFRVWVAEDGKT